MLILQQKNGQSTNIKALHALPEKAQTLPKNKPKIL
jgi:hypothetical protein